MPRGILIAFACLVVLAVWLMDGTGELQPEAGSSRVEREARAEAEVFLEAAGESEGASERESEREREAVGPEMVRFEVVAVLPNGEEVGGPTVTYGGPGFSAETVEPTARGRTWIAVEPDREVALVVMATVDGKVYRGDYPLHEVTSETVYVSLINTCSVVTGTVTRDGVPVSGITVWMPEYVSDFGGLREMAQTKTDELGAFKLIVEGRFRGELRVGTERQAKVTIGRGVDPEFRQSLQVEAGEERVINIELEPGALTLLVTDRDGRPRAHAAYVSLIKIQSVVGEQDRVTRTLAADKEGKIRFVGLEAGDYWALIRGFENRPTPPRRVRVSHPGGDHEVEVRTPGFAKLRVTTKAKVEGEWMSVPSQVWVVERDGVPYQVWDENLQSGWVTELDAEVEPLVHRVSPGVLRLRAGAPEIGFGEAVVSLPEGAEESVVIELSNPGVKLTIEDPHGSLQSTGSIQFSDPQGRLLGSRRLAFGRQAANADSTREPIEVVLPEAGPIVAFTMGQTGRVTLGAFYLYEEGSTWIVPAESTSH